MNANIPLFTITNEKVQRNVLLFFPKDIFTKIIMRKYGHRDIVLIIIEYMKYYNLKYYSNIPKKLYEENPKDLIKIKREFFLPIYSVYASGMTFSVSSYDSLENNMNNTFYVNDFFFIANSLNRNLAIYGGIYYYVDPDEYYSFLQTFKLPNQNIKTNYIHDFMPNLSRILQKYSIDFTDFEYYIFYRNTAVFDRRPDKIRKSKLVGIDNRYINFFKQNYYYNFEMSVSSNEDDDRVGISRSFQFTKSTLKFVITKFRFFFIPKNANFTIFILNNIDQFDIEEIREKDYLTCEKKHDSSYSSDGITIQEFFNENKSDVDPVLTFTSLNDLDYFEYSLNHPRLGRFILISYKIKQEENILPKIFSFGDLIKSSLNF